MAFRLSTGLRNKLLGDGSTDKDFKNLFANGILKIFSGSQPADADTTESGTLLCTITLASGAFTGGVSTNGINFGTASAGAIAKAAAETWSGVVASTGTAGWFRFYANDATTGASTTAARFDGAIATSGAELNMSSTSLTSGATTTITSFSVTFPANA